MTVCKPQRQKKGGQRAGGGISSLAFPPSFLACNLNGSWETRGAAQDCVCVWGGCLLEEVERERRPCILLLFSLFLPGWKISRPPVFLGWGLVGRVIRRPAGERLQRSYPLYPLHAPQPAVSHSLRRRAKGLGARGGGGV